MKNPSTQFKDKISEGHAKATAKPNAYELKRKRLKYIDARTSTFGKGSFSLVSVTGIMIALSVLAFMAIEVGKY